MSLGDIATAMMGIAGGAEKERDAMRSRQVEDESLKAQKLKLKQMQAEHDRYNRMTESTVTSSEQRARLGTSAADVATGTQEGMIGSTNLKNTDAITKYRERLDSGVPQKEALSQLSKAERDIVENTLQGERAGELIKQGAAGAEAQAQVAGAKSATSGSERSIAKDAIAKAIGLDKTIAYAKSNQAQRSSTEDRRAREDIVSDELNGVYANNAVARKSMATSGRKMAEIQSKLATARQKSGFDMRNFARENVDGVMGAAVDAAWAAGIGGDAAVNALPLINMDADGDGALDYVGATSTAIRDIDGEKYLVAIDDSGEIVRSTTAPEVPGMKVKDLATWHASNKAGKSGKAGAPRKPTPVKLSEVDTLNDLSYDLLTSTFGVGTEDIDGDGNPDQFTSIKGKVPEDFVKFGDKIMEKVHRDTSAYLAKQQAAGTSIAEAQAGLATPADVARKVYGATDQDISNAMALATVNANTKAKAAALRGESGLGAMIREAKGTERNFDDPKYQATPEMIEQELNQTLLTTIAKHK